MRPMRISLALLCLAATLPAQEATPALSLLEATARKYQMIGSYEHSAIAVTPLDGGFMWRAHETGGYTFPKFTPPELPVPMRDGESVGFLGMFDKDGKPEPKEYLAFHSFRSCGPSIPFSEISWRVISAKITGTETVQSHTCQIVTVLYEGKVWNPNGEPVRFWIDPHTDLIWKMRYTDVDPSSKTRQPGARWTITWDWWRENQHPPAWRVELGKMENATERALIGHTAPEIVGLSIADQRFQLSRLKGSVVVLDFWGTWCGPCSEQMASLEKLKTSLSGKPVQIWSVTEDKADVAKRWIAERGHMLPTVCVKKGSAFKAYGIDVLPQWSSSVRGKDCAPGGWAEKRRGPTRRD